MIDIIFPNKNEKEFIELAEKLDHKGLVLVYKDKKEIPDFKKLKTKLKVYTGIITGFKGIETAKKNSDLVIVKSSDADRRIFEKSRADLIFEFEGSERKDFIHHKASGLNQVLCKLASKRKISIGFSFSSLLNASNYRRAQIIGRMMQNIKLCRKYKVKTVIASFASTPYEMRSAKDLEAFFSVIGMHPKECKEALQEITKRVK